MIDIPTLRQALADGENWVMFDPAGDLLHDEPPRGAGPATVVVEVVTDAVKRVGEGRVVGSVDRSVLWRVQGFLLHRIVLDKLGSGTFQAPDLLEAVPATGFSWQTMPRRPLVED